MLYIQKFLKLIIHKNFLNQVVTQNFEQSRTSQTCLRRAFSLIEHSSSLLSDFSPCHVLVCGLQKPLSRLVSCYIAWQPDFQCNLLAFNKKALIEGDWTLQNKHTDKFSNSLLKMLSLLLSEDFFPSRGPEDFPSHLDFLVFWHSCLMK